MFRLIRLIILLTAAFLAGMMYERGKVTPDCEKGRGIMVLGTCVGLDFDQ